MPLLTTPLADARDAIVRILWDDAIARVTARDLPVRLQRGDEYLDLQCLGAGVRCVGASMCPTGGELARKAVSAATWDRLLARLPPSTPSTPARGFAREAI